LAEELAKNPSARSPADLSSLHEALLNITPEGRLQRETKDIIDELEIMIQIVRKQKDVIKRFKKHVEAIFDPNGKWREEVGAAPRQHPRSGTDDDPGTGNRRWFSINTVELLEGIGDYLDELSGLKANAESTASSVSKTPRWVYKCALTCLFSWTTCWV